MPTYSYVCETCKFRDDLIRPIDRRNNPAVCPICAGDHKESFMRRDMFAEQQVNPPETPFWRPQLSEALGVHPAQIDDARKRFPDHKFTPDGRMILESYKERKRVMKDLGFADWD